MKEYIFFIALFFSYSLLKAQDTWETGYVIHKEQDTITGLILERTDTEMAHFIKFREKSAAEVQVYNAGEIAGFGLMNGRNYESHSFVDEKGNRTSVFAKNLVRGKLDLFAWRHPQRLQPDFFVVNRTSGESVYLKKPVKKEITGKDGKLYNHRDKKYINSLSLIKGDSASKPAEIRFSEKLIQRDIIDYNSNFINDFPQKIHEERIDYSFDVLAGVPVQFATGLSTYRAALYFNRTKPERSTGYVITRGIIYNHHVVERTFPADFRNGSLRYKAQMLNLVPFAIKFQGSSKNIQPYGYAGAGLAVFKTTDLLVKDFQENGTDTNYYFLPTLNIGVGARLKIGPTWLLAEITPTIQGIFLNTGISF
ncbi:MAG TPA: hypothetical protein VLN72_05015 [Gillisia sp.]|nr:hypothetical protein [Gillisia sp.]